MPNNLIQDKLNNLTEKEREEALKILKEYYSGNQKSYQNLLYKDYDEIPVDVETFLHDEKYLGKGLTDEEGRFTLFPYWENLLKEIYPDPLKPAKYNTLALTGGIGLGKSTEAVIIGIYELYRMLCLKDPYIYYGLQPIDLISFAVMNITLDAAKSVAWDKMQNLIQSSEWFMSRGSLTKSDYPEWKPPKGIELIAGSQTRHIIGRAVYWAFFDEISFIPNTDVEKQKEKAKQLVNTASARMQSRFMKNETNPTILVLASSKRTEQSFMETWIENKKKQDSKTVRIVDEPQWVIRTDKNSTKTFKVAIGNKFLDSEIVPFDTPKEMLDIYRARGFTLIDVPIGYYENFLDDINIALTDIAGISTSSTNRYFSGPRIESIKNKNLKNLMTKEVIQVGNSKDDKAEYYDYIDTSLITSYLISRPLYIHLDMSLSGDKTGIAGVYIKGKKPSKDGVNSKDLSYGLAFSFAVKAPKGYQVSFEKNRNFIRWLKNYGFKIKGISSDTFQSADLLQQLSAEGFKTDVISVDRVDSESHICLPYQTLRSAMYEERLEIYSQGSTLLTDEWLGLERNNNTGKVDHSPSGVNCLTGDTKVSLTDGRELTILELLEEFNSGKLNYVYSFNEETKIIEPKPIQNVFCSGRNAKLIEVELDNSEVIRCTPEHRFMLRDGSYLEAEKLTSGTSLMPLYRKYSKNGLKGYRLYYEPMEDSWHYEHRRFAKEIFDEKHLVHHKDCNPKNNNPDNLLWCSKAEHIKIHQLFSTGASSDASKKKRSVSVKRNHETLRNTKEYWVRYHPECTPEEAWEKHKEIAKKAQEETTRKNERINRIEQIFNVEYDSLSEKEKATYQGKLTGYDLGYDVFSDKKTQIENKRKAAEQYFNVDYSTLSEHERRSYSIRYARIVDPTYQQRVSLSVSKNHKQGKYENAYKALQEHNDSVRGISRPKEVIEKIQATRASRVYKVTPETRKKISESISKKRWYNNGQSCIYIDCDAEVPAGYVPGRIKTWKNHKVKAVRVLDFTEDVYDLTIQDNHNFALSSGIFVHNSKDISDAVCGALFNASKHAQEYVYEYGEDLQTAVEANVDYEQEFKNQLTVDFEQELMKIQDPLRPRMEAEGITDANNFFKDFGMGKATTKFQSPFVDDIIFI